MMQLRVYWPGSTPSSHQDLCQISHAHLEPRIKMLAVYVAAAKEEQPHSTNEEPCRSHSLDCALGQKTCGAFPKTGQMRGQYATKGHGRGPRRAAARAEGAEFSDHAPEWVLEWWCLEACNIFGFFSEPKYLGV